MAENSSNPGPLDQHLPFTVIRDFAYDRTILQPDQLWHFHDCALCSRQWWKLKLEAKRRKRDGDVKKKLA
jgi:hypothetical protein